MILSAANTRAENLILEAKSFYHLLLALLL